MLKFDEKFMQIRNLPEPSPNFNNVLKILRNERPYRPTLFELYLMISWNRKFWGSQLILKTRLRN